MYRFSDEVVILGYDRYKEIRVDVAIAVVVVVVVVVEVVVVVTSLWQHD